MKKVFKWTFYAIGVTFVFLVLLVVLVDLGDLDSAIKAGNVPVARRLIEKDGSLIKYKNKDGYGALQIAVDANQKEIVELLLQHGADIRELNKDGSTLLHHAAHLNSLDMTRLLIDRGLNVDSVWSGATTALHLAAGAGHMEVARELLARGANVNGANGEDWYETPLYEAVGHAQADMAQFLIGKGADCKRRRHSDGDTLLFNAGIKVLDKPLNPEIINVLIDCGLNVNERNMRGDTPLHSLSRKNDRIVRRLLEKGADVSARNNFDQTPLISAARFTTVTVVELLVAQGADINERDKFGKSVLHYMVESGRDLVRFLLDKGAAPAGALEPAVTVGNFEVLELLLAQKFYAEDAMGEKNVALRLAIEKKRPDMVNALVHSGAKLNELSRDEGMSPLHQAIGRGHMEIAKLLVDKGANVNLPDRSGRLPLHQAVEAGWRDMTVYLVEHGADLEQKDREGRTAVELASEDIATVLVAKGARRKALRESTKDAQVCNAILDHANKGTLRSLIEELPENEGRFAPDGSYLPDEVDAGLVVALNGERFVVGSKKTLPRVVWRFGENYSQPEVLCHFWVHPERTTERLYLMTKFDIALAAIFPEDVSPTYQTENFATEAGPAIPGDLLSDAVVAVVNASRGENGSLGPGIESTDGASVALNVDVPGKNVVLILNTYYPVSWSIAASPGTKIKGVILSGGHHSSPVNRSSVVRSEGVAVYTTRLPTAMEMKSREFLGFLKRLELWFGVKKVDYFVGEVVLPKAVVISGSPMTSSYLNVAGPSAVTVTTPLEFNLHTRALQPVKWRANGATNVVYEKIDYLFEGKFAESPIGDEVFVVRDDKLYALNRKNGDRSYFPLPVGFPELSRVSDMAYDRSRNILMLATTAGSGHFYRFDAVGKKWLDFRSAEGHDVISLAYNTENDEYVALTDKGRLLRLDSSGKEKSRIEMADKLDGVGRWSEETQRVPRLAIFAGKTDMAFVCFEMGRVAAIWTYNHTSGDARLTYRAR